jgi:hypothetical protein
MDRLLSSAGIVAPIDPSSEHGEAVPCRGHSCCLLRCRGIVYTHRPNSGPGCDKALLAVGRNPGGGRSIASLNAPIADRIYSLLATPLEQDHLCREATGQTTFAGGAQPEDAAAIAVNPSAWKHTALTLA